MTGSYLLTIIEELRGSLVSQVMKNQYDLLHPEVIKLSQELDNYIATYTKSNS